MKPWEMKFAEPASPEADAKAAAQRPWEMKFAEPAAPDLPPLEGERKKAVRRAWHSIRHRGADPEGVRKELEASGIDSQYLDIEMKAQAPLAKGPSPMERAREISGKLKAQTGAYGRAGMQGATLNFADEALAGVNSLISGAPYSEEYRIQQENIAQAKKEIGPWGYGIAEAAGGFAVPGIGTYRVAHGVNRAQQGLRNLSLSRRAATGAATAGTMGTVNAYGEQNKEKNIGSAVGVGLASAALGGGIPFLAAAGANSMKLAGRTGSWLADKADEIRHMRTSPGTEYMPRSGAIRNAAEDMAADLRKSHGIVSPGEMNYRYMDVNNGQVLPGTNRLLLNQLPETAKSKVLGNIKNLKHLPARGNFIERAIKDQMTPGGIHQMERLSTRVTGGLPTNRRNGGIVNRTLRAGIDKESVKIDRVVKRNRNATAPGIADFVNSPGGAGLKLYRDARAAKGTPGAGRQVRPALPDGEHQTALNRWLDSGSVGRKPQLLTDRNYSPSLHKSMKEAISNDPKGMTAGARRNLAELKRIGAASAPRSGTRIIEDSDARIHQIKQNRKAYKDGRNLYGQKPEVQDAAVDGYRLENAGQTQYRQAGNLHAQQDVMAKHKFDAEKARTKLVGTTRNKELYDAAGPSIPSRELGRQLKAVGLRENFFKNARAILGLRGVDDQIGVADVMEVARKSQFSTSYGAIAGIGKLTAIIPQAQHHAFARLVLDSSVGGERLVMEAMDRAVARGAERGPALRRAVTESIIRTALGKTQVEGNPTRVTVTGKDSLENYKGTN